MYWCHIDRVNLLSVLPKDAIAAEVGTHRGDFADSILTHARPAKLFLIDKWDFAADKGYETQAKLLPDNRSGEEVYRGVQKRFGAQIAAGRMELIRSDSLEAARRFAPGTFDWVYLDADHRYDAVRAELDAYARLLKPDGFLLGHDFEERTFPPAAAMDFGITDAVRDFLKNSDFQMLLLTSDAFASYCLTRQPASARAVTMVAMLLLAGVQVTSVKDFQKTRFGWEAMVINERPHYMRRLEMVD